MGKTLITAALPYANAKLHLGHLRSTYIPSDIYTRYLRLKGEDVIYICATDEHGTPIAVRAENEKITPKQVADKYHESISTDLKRMGCSFDLFGRTTLPIHYEITQEFFKQLLEKGHIYKAEYEQLFCPQCSRFLPDRFVEGTCPYCGGEARGDQCENCGRYLKPIELISPRCTSCKGAPEIRRTEQWFFKLSAFRDFLEEWVTGNSGLSTNVRNYALQWVREGLVDWCITRDMSWGVPVPVEGVKDKVVYVWFDAPIGYISTTVEWTRLSGEPEKWKAFWEGEGRIIHFIGKDIIYHHAIFWPAMLKGRGEYRLPSKIVAGEYLTLGGRKMSKSRNWSVEVEDYLRTFEPDPLRYCLMVISPLNRDADFTWSEYARRNNDELADILGNFIHRTLMFTRRFFAEIPKPSEMDDADRALLKFIAETAQAVEAAVEAQEFHQSLREIMNLAAAGNKYLNEKQPWKTIKADRDQAATTLYVVNQIVKALAIMLEPFMPFTAEKIWKTLNMPQSVHDQKWKDISQELPSGQKINQPEPLFKKIRPEEVPTIG